MAPTVLAAAVVPGPSHESCLPRRPPCHWLRPPRESVVNALLPWRARTSRPTRLGARQSDAGTGLDQRSRPALQSASNRLLETDHLRAQGRMPISLMIQAHTPPGLEADYPSAENRRPSETIKRGTGEPPHLRSRGRRFGSDILWQTGRNRSTRSMGRATRLGRALADAVPVAPVVAMPHARSIRCGACRSSRRV